MANIAAFTNDTFRVLAYLYDHMDNAHTARITQKELGEELGLSRVTINKILQRLHVGECVVRDTSKIGRYVITDKGINVVKSFRRVDSTSSHGV